MYTSIHAYTYSESDDDERAKRGGGLNGHLTHDCIKASGLLWHVAWADVGGIKGQAGHGGVEGQFDGTRNGRDHSIGACVCTYT